MASNPDESRRRALGAVAVAAGVVAWWPAFTLGAWGEVFFEQILTVWAAATATFVIVVIGGGQPRRLATPVVASLLLPTVWIVLSFLPGSQGSWLDDAIGLFGAVLTIVGLPAMVWVILTVARPEAAGRVSGRTWAAAAAALCVVALAAFALGRLSPHFLTCRDFQISGNSAPAGCTPGR